MVQGASFSRAKKIVLASSILTSIALPGAAQALPSFAVQTDQPCSACHVGAFGPGLKPFGRDFKLYGYTAADGKPHDLPVAVYLRQSFTQTGKDESPPTAPNHVYGPSQNSSFALDEASAWLAGRVNDTTGVYLEGSYDGVGNTIHLDNADARHIHEGKLFGQDYVAGITVNNGPTTSDIWNSTSTWGFPYNASKLAAGPVASARIDGNIQQTVAGAGGYSMINDWVYLEFDAYKGLSENGLSALGQTPIYDAASGNHVDQYTGVLPYWRAAVQHELVKDHYFQIGTYGLAGNLYPGDDHTSGSTDHFTDAALDANYQWLGGGNDHFVSAHSTYIHEKLNLGASHFVNSTNSSDTLNTYRAEVSYSYQDTYTPTVQFFRTWGSSDSQYWSGTTNGSPNTQGYLVELALVPWGKPDSPVLPWFAYNSRLELQYTAYTEFNGTHHGASNNNTIFLDLGIIMGPKW